jgi:hypothetical protein
VQGEFGWPLYDPNRTSHAQLGNVANQTGVVFTKGNLIDAACAYTSVSLQIQNAVLGIWVVERGKNGVDFSIF